jgi:ketosteroid isomerase-like protein
MSRMPIEQTMVDFFEAVNGRDLEQMGSLLTENAEFYFPKTQPLLGKKRILRFFGILFRQYPELTFEVRRVIIERDTAAAHWTNRGVSRKKEPYENEGVIIMEFNGNRIRFISDFFKDTEKF